MGSFIKSVGQFTPPKMFNFFFISNKVLENIFHIVNIYSMATLIVKNIPDEVRNLFKAVCAEKGKTIREELIRLMQEKIEIHRKIRL